MSEKPECNLSRLLVLQERASDSNQKTLADTLMTSYLMECYKAVDKILGPPAKSCTTEVEAIKAAKKTAIDAGTTPDLITVTAALIEIGQDYFREQLDWLEKNEEDQDKILAILNRKFCAACVYLIGKERS